MADELRDESSPSADLTELARHFELHRFRLLAMFERRIDPVLAPRLSADDMLQELYLSARRRWGRFAATGMTPYAWLYRLALDTLIEAWRRESREGRNPHREMRWPDRSSVQLGLKLIGSATNPDDAAARVELRHRVRAALQELQPEDREILAMRHFDEMPFREAAMVVGVSENAAMQRYVRALRRFKALWLAFNSNGGIER